MIESFDALQKNVADIGTLLARLFAQYQWLRDENERLRAEIDQNRIDLEEYRRDVEELTAQRDRMRAALVRLRDCDWVITLPDRMDGVRQIAREALEAKE